MMLRTENAISSRSWNTSDYNRLDYDTIIGKQAVIVRATTGTLNVDTVLGTWEAKHDLNSCPGPHQFAGTSVV